VGQVYANLRREGDASIGASRKTVAPFCEAQGPSGSAQGNAAERPHAGLLPFAASPKKEMSGEPFMAARLRLRPRASQRERGIGCGEIAFSRLRYRSGVHARHSAALNGATSAVVVL